MDKILEPKFNTFSYFMLSFILYISIVSGIFIKLTYFRSEEPKKYTDTKDAFMDIMIVEREQDIVVKAPEKKEEVVKVEEPEIVQKTEEPSLKDLFKDINISKLKDDKVVKKTESLKEQSRKKPEKNQSQNSQKKASDVINALKLDKVAKAPKTQMTGEYHPYFGQIERILQAKWSAYKADSNDNAEVEISIDLSGNFSYDIKKLSYNSEFNDKVREFLQSMTFEKFPPSELGRTVTLKTTLVDKIE
ncbi:MULTISPECIES: TonB C-terminal domain-containing protein [unclassified Campylobacter]|uniref:TonB C-terminal domain-containing protein n=1 Tax=unclassified Campylobacter TaxID=2593542 RepID=UPI0014763411|nr:MULTISPECIES: TonB C-terminal domain-containing protein [unclassified Campylobacter]